MVESKQGTLEEKETGSKKGRREKMRMWESPPLIPPTGMIK